MAIEKKFRAISAQAFTSDGTAAGRIQIASPKLFRVEHLVILKSDTEDALQLQIKDILDDGQTMFVGPIDNALNTRYDISAYTLVDNSTVEALEQVRPKINDIDILRATYEEAPSSAQRAILVDDYGKKFSSSAPFPTENIITASPENITGNVASAGVPDTINRTDTNDVTLFFINNPSKGTLANAIGDVLYVSIDGTTTYVTINRGEAQYFSGSILNGDIKIDTNVNGTNYEIILWN